MKKIQVKALALAGACLLATAAQAQTYPDRPVHMVVGFAAGGYADGVARLVGQRLSDRLGQPVVVENRGGAGGNVAARAVATAKPDGYALLVTTTAIAINATLYKNPGYDLARDFVPVAMTVATPGVFTVHPSNPVSTLPELIRTYKGKRLTYATAGVGSSSHLAGDYLLRSLAKLEAVHVPYQGGAPAVTAGVSNQVDALSISMPTVIGHVRGGRLKVLAVSSLKPVAALPGVPTVAEAGFPDFEEKSWVGIFAPAGTPLAIADKLNEEVNRVLADPEAIERFAKLGAEPDPMSRAQFDDYIKKEVAKWAQMIKASGVSVN